MKKLTTIFILVLSQLGLAQAQVLLSADKTTLTMEDTLNVTISVEGARGASEPVLESLNGFEIAGRSQSSQVQIINGSVASQTVYQYSLNPTGLGTFTLGPASVTYQNKPITSSALTVTVTKPSAAATQHAKQYYYVTGDVDNPNPMVGEPITYSFKFYTRLNVRNANLDAPSFKGMWKEGEPKQTTSRRVIGGLQWEVTEIQSVLIPLNPGMVTIEPTKLVANFIVRQSGRSADPFYDDFFFRSVGKTKRVVLATEPVKVQVTPLPSAGRPASFSGLVGRFKVESQLSKSELKVGDSTTLTIKIEGRGNIREAKLTPPAGGDFKIYEDAPEANVIVRDSAVGGNKVFKWAIVPLKEGRLEIPITPLSFYNTQTKSYESLPIKPLVLNVAAGSGEQLTHVQPNLDSSQRKAVKVLGEDLMPIKRDVASLTPDTLSATQKMWGLILLFGLPILHFFGLFFSRRRMRIGKDLGYARRTKAYSAFRDAVKQQSGSASYESLSILLRTYLGDKLNIDGTALTPVEVADRLRSTSVDEKARESVVVFLQSCEQRQYGGGGGQAVSDEVVRALQSMVEQLEKQL